MANIIVSHTIARGSIPRIRIFYHARQESEIAEVEKFSDYYDLQTSAVHVFDMMTLEA